MNKINIQSLPQPDYFVQSELDRLRVNVGFAGTDKRVIMVTSTVPNEGKSYITQNLWLELAKAGYRVCLVDADMRKSETRSSLRLATSSGEKLVGLSHYLAGYTNIEDVIYETNLGQAYIIPTLTLVNPSLLLEGERVDNLLSYLRENFDYVLVDTPPLGIVSDGQLFASKCDGCVLVVRAHETSKNSVKNSIRQVNAVNCPLIGIVLNRVESHRARGYYSKDYYSKGYSKYYYYYTNSEDSTKKKRSKRIGRFNISLGGRRSGGSSK